jgi:hypothetical protein
MAVRSKDINKELDILDHAAVIDPDDAPETVLKKHVLKACCLLVKLLRDYRNNQVLIMRAQGIKLANEESEDRNET